VIARVAGALVVTIAVTSAAFPQTSQTPARDPVSKPGGSRIRGRITAAEDGKPIRKATVRITAIEGRAPDSVITDNDGRFEFTNVGAGSYTVTASSPGYVTWSYGQIQTLPRGKPIELGANTAIERINFTLARGGVIIGAVTDEFGDYLIGSTVLALREEYIRGRRELVSVGPSSTTNDIGEFRIFGLPAGDYAVSVSPRIVFGGEPGTANTTYPPTYYPGTIDPGAAQRVRVALGQTSSIAIAMTPARSARVSGTVFDVSGQPMKGGYVNVNTSAGVFGIGAGQVRPDGTFAITGVPPGQFELIAGSSSVGPDGHPQVARGFVTVSGDDVTGVSLAAASWVDLAGRVVVDRTLGDTPLPSGSRIVQQRLGIRDPLASYGGNAPVGRDGRFETSAPAGAVFVTIAGLPKDWRVKAVFLNGVDVADTGFDLRAGGAVHGLEVEITNRGPFIGGRVVNDRGDAVKQYAVVVFPIDRDKRAWNSRYLAAAQPGDEGRFRISLPAGDYYAVAVDSLVAGQSSDPEFLLEMEREGTKFVLADGETKPLDLKLVYR